MIDERNRSLELAEKYKGSYYRHKVTGDIVFRDGLEPKAQHAYDMAMLLDGYEVLVWTHELHGKIIDNFINQKSNTMKRSKIKRVVNESKPYGKAIYYDVEMENGDKINVGLPSDLDRSSEITYKITGDEGQQEFTKAECDWKTGIKKPSGSGNTYTPQTNNDNVKGIKVGHAITNAVSLVCAHGPIEGLNVRDSIKDYAKMIYEISEELNNEL